MVGSFVRTLTYAVQAISSRLHGLTYGKKGRVCRRGLPYLRTHFRGHGVCPKYRTFITFKEHLSHFVEHSSLSKSTSRILQNIRLFFTTRLLQCEHSYTELKQILQILRDMRHAANGCVSKVLTPPWFAKLDLSDMQNIRHF